MNLFQQALQGLASVTGVDRLAGVVAAGVGIVTDGKMWRSLGWIILGVVLIVLGLVWLFRREIGGAAATAAKAAVL